MDMQVLSQSAESLVLSTGDCDEATQDADDGEDQIGPPLGLPWKTSIQRTAGTHQRAIKAASTTPKPTQATRWPSHPRMTSIRCGTISPRSFELLPRHRLPVSRVGRARSAA